ncbi:hypothetical protein [Enterococcus sp. 2201sp1_2201st1_B8_2201SCRN_220225]|uniref:DUF6933 domain-containing protein n=1 Tax=unclassified Enterococcus TaxID=2608891 RepID=UPI0034A2033B
MIINPTKKSLPLFSEINKVADKEAAKAFSLANPLFSWHGTYFNINRKKILLLMNDATYLTVVISDVNAKNKEQLAEEILKGIRKVLKAIKIPKAKIETYFELAKDLEVSAGFQRSVLGYLSVAEQVVSQKITTANLSWGVQKELSLKASHIPFAKQEYRNAEELTRKMFEHPFAINEVTLPEKVVIEKTWTDYQKWQAYEGRDGSYNQYEKIADEIRENNEKMLLAFKDYLIADGLSSRAAEDHRFNVSVYVDDFLLYYQINTVLSPEASPYDFLSDWFVSKALWANARSVKRTGTSLRKFFGFMEAAEEITNRQLKDLREEISDGIMAGLETLEMLEEGFYDDLY